MQGVILTFVGQRAYCDNRAETLCEREYDNVFYEDKMNNMRPETMGAEPIENAVLAMAYVPMQKFGALYNNEDALCAGTLFADLDKPFCGKGVK